MPDRAPYNSKYCKEVNCHLRRGNKCTVAECVRKGAEKWPAYFTMYGVLADGDERDARPKNISNRKSN